MATKDRAEDMLTAIAGVLKTRRIRSADLFRTVSASGDSQATPEELHAALESSGMKLEPDQFAALVARLDPERSGKVGLKEFERALRQADKKQRTAPTSQKPTRKPSKTMLKKEDKEEFRQIFCLFKQLCRTGGPDEPELVDWDESGTIAVDDLEQLLETVGLNLTKAQMDVIVKDLDKNNDGMIVFEEFCSVMNDQIQVGYSGKEISTAFKSFQKNSPDGFIKVKDLRESLKAHMHKDMVGAEIDELILHYQDCFVKLPGSDEEYFNYHDYIDMMQPLGGLGSADDVLS
jgi:calmodulin